jgi:hypothetical protein
MAQACIRTTLLIAGVLLCGVPSAFPATELRGVAETPLAEKRADRTDQVPCGTSRACGLKVSQALGGDTPVGIISDHIRRQGYTCDEPRQAERDREASRPNLTVWVLTCGNATYRVTLIPDMAARVERLK